MSKLPVDNLTPNIATTAVSADVNSDSLYVSTTNAGILKVDLTGINSPREINSTCAFSSAVHSNVQFNGMIYAACSADPSAPPSLPYPTVIAISEPAFNSSTVLTSADCSSPTAASGVDRIVFVSCAASFNTIYRINGLNATAIVNSTICKGASSLYVRSNSTIYATCSLATNFTVIRLDINPINSVVTVTYLATHAQIPAPNAITGGPQTQLYVLGANGLYVIVESGRSVTYLSPDTGQAVFYDATDGRLYLSSESSVSSLNVTTHLRTTIMTYALKPGSLFRRPGVGIYISTGLGLFLTDQPVLTYFPSPKGCTVMATVSYDVNSQEITGVCKEQGNFVSMSSTESSIVAGQTETPCDTTVNDVYRDPGSGITYFACADDSTSSSTFLASLSADGSEVLRFAGPTDCQEANGVYFSNGNLVADCGESTDAVYVLNIGMNANTSVVQSSTAVGIASYFQCTSAGSIFLTASSTKLFVSCYGSVISIDGTVQTSLMPRKLSQCSYPRQVFVLDLVDTEQVLATCDDDTLVTAVTASNETAFVYDSHCSVRAQFTASSTLTAVICDPYILLQPREGAVRKVHSLNCAPEDLTVPSDPSGEIWVACSPGYLAVIRSNSSQLLTVPSFNATACVSAVYLHRDQSGRILVACTGNVRLFTFDPNLNSTKPLLIGAQFNQITALTSYSDYAFVGSGDGILAVNQLDGTYRLLVDHYTCRSPSSMQFDQSAMRVYAVCDTSAASITIIAVDWSMDVATFTTNATFHALATSATCSNPTSISMSQRTRTLYASCGEGIVTLSQEFRCYPGYYFNRGECSPCPLHSFRSIPQVSTFGQCTDCPRGFITTDVGSIGCQACPIGYFERNRVCTLCDVGRYQNVTGQTECLPCEVGTATVTVGSVACLECKPGTFAKDEAALVCDSCSLGSYQNGSRATSCIACEKGKFSAQVGSSTCQDCAPGTATNNTSSLSCRLCLPGEYQPDQGQTDCLPCNPGRYAVAAASLICIDCDFGYYASSPGTAICLACAPGRYSNVSARSTECDPCQPGTYQGGLGKASCEMCEAQTYSEKPESTSCTRCDAQVNSARSSCNTTVCDKNKQYNSVTSNCDVCDLGTASVQGGKCFTCGLNTYTPQPGADCVSCQQQGMEGLVCSGGVASDAEGYWAFLSVVRDRDSGELEMLYQTVPCPINYCHGSALQLTSSAPSGSNSSSTVNSIIYCDFPRLSDPSNLFCAQCVDGYIPWNDKCVECSGTNGPLLFGGFVLSFVIVLFLLQSSSSAAGALSILLYFIQTAALQIGPISKSLNWLQVINFDTKSTPTCLADWTPQQQTLFSLFIPLILLCELALIAIVHSALSRGMCGSALRDKFHRMNRDFSVDAYIAGAFSVLLFCYTQVSTASFSYLYCVQVDDASQSRRQFSAPTVDCDSKEYKTFLAPVCIAIVLYVVAFPVGTMALLWRNKDHLFKGEAALSLGSSSASKVTSFLTRYAPLYKMYEPRAWFWQSLLLLRRAAFVVVSVVLVYQPAVRFFVYTMLHFAALMLHLYALPFQAKKLNQLDTVAHCILVVMSAMLTTYLPPNYPLGVQVFILLLIVPAAAIMTGFVVYGSYARWNSGRNQSTSEAARTRASASVDEVTKSSVPNGAAANAAIEMPPVGSSEAPITDVSDDPHLLNSDLSQASILSPSELHSEQMTL